MLYISNAINLLLLRQKAQNTKTMSNQHKDTVYHKLNSNPVPETDRPIAQPDLYPVPSIFASICVEWRPMLLSAARATGVFTGPTENMKANEVEEDTDDVHVNNALMCYFMS